MKMKLRTCENTNREPGWHARSTEYPCQAWAPTKDEAIADLRRLVEKHETALAAKESGKSNWKPAGSGSVTFTA
jgi:hypothetical protein